MATPTPVAPPPTTIMSHGPGWSAKRLVISERVIKPILAGGRETNMGCASRIVEGETKMPGKKKEVVSAPEEKPIVIIIGRRRCPPKGEVGLETQRPR